MPHQCNEQEETQIIVSFIVLYKVVWGGESYIKGKLVFNYEMRKVFFVHTILAVFLYSSHHDGIPARSAPLHETQRLPADS